jgi:hypothetical protein
MSLIPKYVRVLSNPKKTTNYYDNDSEGSLQDPYQNQKVRLRSPTPKRVTRRKHPPKQTTNDYGHESEGGNDQDGFPDHVVSKSLLAIIAKVLLNIIQFVAIWICICVVLSYADELGIVLFLENYFDN